jgi:alpha-galactosidase
VADDVAFPHGIKYIADYVHSKGLKFGIYTDRGTKTCAGRPGSEGYEKKDAQTYASWGVDYLKEDSCYASSDHNTAFQQYGLMRDSLNATGRDIYFSLCGWNSWYAPEGWSLGNSWRIAGDCNTWPNVQNAIDVNVPLTNYAKPGGWNDPDMLIGSDPSTAAHLSQAQSRTMFSLWAVMAAPLLIGSNIRSLNAWDLQTYSNTEIIAVNQDPAGKQGVRLSGGNLVNGASSYNVWGRKLQDGSAVLNFLNNNNKTAEDITCEGACFTALGFKSTDQLKVRDLWSHSDIGTITAGSGYTAKAVPENGGSVTLKFSM